MPARCRRLWPALLILCVSGCSGSEARAKIAGRSWVHKYPDSGVYSIYNLASDGGLDIEYWRSNQFGSVVPFARLVGTWSVSGDVLTLKTGAGSEEDSRYEVLGVTDDELRFKSRAGNVCDCRLLTAQDRAVRFPQSSGK